MMQSKSFEHISQVDLDLHINHTGPSGITCHDSILPNPPNQDSYMDHSEWSSTNDDAVMGETIDDEVYSLFKLYCSTWIANCVKTIGQ